MRIFFPKETSKERRVAALPSTIQRLADLGIDVSIESGFGNSLYILDKDFEDSGAKIIKDRSEGLSVSDIVCRINKPPEDEIHILKDGGIHISFLDPFNEKNLVDAFVSSRTTAISM